VASLLRLKRAYDHPCMGEPHSEHMGL